MREFLQRHLIVCDRDSIGPDRKTRSFFARTDQLSFCNFDERSTLYEHVSRTEAVN